MEAYVQCSLAKYHAVKNSVSVILVLIQILKPLALHYFDY